MDRRVPLGRRFIIYDRGRFAITIAGVGFAVVLALFLLALYEGVRVESNGYIAARPAQVWVAQENTTNFIKASSFIPLAALEVLRGQDKVAEATPLLRLITTVEIGEQRTTAIFIGIDANSELGRPTVVSGSAQLGPGELIIDRALARRYGAQLGDELLVQGRPFKLVGISSGTNAILTQLVFLPVEEAKELLGLKNTASYILVKGKPGVAAAALAQELTGLVPNTNVLTQQAFSNNNIRELREGLLPVLAMAAVLGGIVAVSVLTLLLYGTILERRTEYAILKSIGAPHSYLSRSILVQSLWAVGGGTGFGALAYAAGAPIAVHLVPVVVLSLPPVALLAVAAIALLMGCLAALLPLHRVGKIYPAELFRA